MSVQLSSAILAALPTLNPYGRNWLNSKPAPLVQLLSAMGRVRMATNPANVSWTPLANGSAVYNANENDDIQTAELQQGTYNHAVLNRAIYRASFGVTHTAQAQAALTSAANSTISLVNHIAELYVEKNCDLTTQIDTDLLLGTGVSANPAVGATGNIVGFDKALLTSSSYAGIDVGTVTSFQGNVFGSVGTLDKKKVQTWLNTVYKKSGKKVNFIMGSPETVRVLRDIGDAFFHLNDPRRDGEVGRIGAQSGMFGMAGSSTCSFNGIPVWENSNWADGYLVGGDLNLLTLDFLPRAQQLNTSVINKFMMGVQGNGEDFFDNGLPYYVYGTNKSGPSDKATLEIELQLKVERPNAFFIAKGVTIT